MATKQEIIDAAIVIKNETVNKANSATRVGTTIENIANKSNNYTEYVALLSQTGTNAPVANVLSNTLSGNIVWTRTSIGVYTGTLTGEFTLEKTTLPNDIIASEEAENGVLVAFEHTVNSITITTLGSGGVNTDDALSYLFSGRDFLVVINVYE